MAGPQVGHLLTSYGREVSPLVEEVFDQSESIIIREHSSSCSYNSCAQVERMFSFIKRILGDWRLSLRLDTVDTLLRISVEGPSVEEFDPASSIPKWNEVSMAS